MRPHVWQQISGAGLSRVPSSRIKESGWLTSEYPHWLWDNEMLRATSTLFLYPNKP